jgi:hypothetical protein
MKRINLALLLGTAAALSPAYSQAAGAACNDDEAPKTRMAPPVSFSRWLGENTHVKNPLRFHARLLQIRILRDLPQKRLERTSCISFFACQHKFIDWIHLRGGKQE